MPAYAAASQPGTASGAPPCCSRGCLPSTRSTWRQLKSRLIESAAQRSAAAASATASRRVDQRALESGTHRSSSRPSGGFGRLIGQLDGLPPSLAQLFASIAASEATHVPVLRSDRAAAVSRRVVADRSAALQAALAAEQAASYGYGVVGAHLAGRAREQAAAGRLGRAPARPGISSPR